jgi:hypothetical protein
MNINLNDLRTLYKSFLESRPFDRYRRCPSWKDILATFNNRISGRRRSRIISHISNCPTCARESKWLIETVVLIQIFEKELCAFMRKRKKKYFGFSIPLGHAAATIFGLFALSISIWILIGGSLPSFSTSSRLSTEITSNWHTIEPVGKLSFKSSITFNWIYKGKASNYILEIYDDTLASIWTSPPLITSSFCLSSDTFDIFIRGNCYFWLVVARNSEGTISDSDLTYFEVH